MLSFVTRRMDRTDFHSKSTWDQGALGMDDTYIQNSDQFHKCVLISKAINL